MVQAFLHKGNLTREETHCMVSAIGDVAFGAYQSAEGIAALIGELSGHDSDGRAGFPDHQLLRVAKLAQSMYGLVHVMDGSMNSCVGGSSLQLLSKAANHLGNLTYVAGRLTANGAAIAEELSDAADAWARRDFIRFGRDVGGACRRVLLSGASSELLPEGPPSPPQLINVSAGILQGFFGAGFELDISSDARVVTRPRMHVMDFIQEGNGTGQDQDEVMVTEERTHLNVHIDLHRCVSKNLGLFRAVMRKAWFYFAMASMGHSPTHMMGTFLGVMLQGLPAALARCGVEPRQRQMLAKAVHALRHVQLRLRLPEDRDGTVEAAKDLRSAAEHWSRASWFAFGNDLGRMLQGLALRAYPHRYVLTNAGSLRQLPRLAAAASGDAKTALVGGPGPSAEELAAGGFTSAHQLGAGSGLSVGGVQLVEGVAEGLLHQRGLSHAEGECLMESAGNVLGGASQMAENFVAVFEMVALPDGQAPSYSEPPSTEQLGELMRSLDSLARLAEGFVAKCRSSAKEAFMQALEHLGSLRYVSGRIIANGADVREGIDLALASWKRKDARAFGREVGRIIRKVLLSGQSKPVPPEGDATVPQLVNISAGVLEGFFGRGFELDISSDQKIATMPLFPLAMVLPGAQDMAEKQQEAKRLNVRINLHTCVERNLPLFRAALAGLLGIVDSEDLALHPLNSDPLEGLVEMPDALRRCGIDAEQQEMLMESVTTLGSLHLSLQVPRSGTAMDATRIAELLKRCVSDWSAVQWFALGKDLGEMLREAVMAMSAGHYTIDGTGSLRRHILGLSDAAPEVPPEATKSRNLPAAPAGVLLLGAATLVTTGLFAAARRRWPVTATGASSDAEDSEAGLALAGALE